MLNQTSCPYIPVFDAKNLESCKYSLCTEQKKIYFVFQKRTRNESDREKQKSIALVLKKAKIV